MDAEAADRIQRLEDRLRVLSVALRSFAEATTDYERLLDVVARTLADVVKDGCVVRLLSDGEWLSAAAIHLPFEAHVRDADAIAHLRAHIAAPHKLTEHPAGQRVVKTGEALLVPHLVLGQLRSTATPEIGFCNHVRDDVLLAFRRDALARILHVHGLRRRARRNRPAAHVLIPTPDPSCDPRPEVGHGSRTTDAELVARSGGAVEA